MKRVFLLNINRYDPMTTYDCQSYKIIWLFCVDWSFRCERAVCSDWSTFNNFDYDRWQLINKIFVTISGTSVVKKTYRQYKTVFELLFRAFHSAHFSAQTMNDCFARPTSTWFSTFLLFCFPSLVASFRHDRFSTYYKTEAEIMREREKGRDIQSKTKRKESLMRENKKELVAVHAQFF